MLDASAAVELLRETAVGRRVKRTVAEGLLAVPAHFDAEVLSALGRLSRAGEMNEERVSRSLAELTRMPIRRYPPAPLMLAAWELRANVQLRDALYVVLAQRLGASLVTSDRRLARASGLEVALILA